MMSAAVRPAASAGKIDHDAVRGAPSGDAQGRPRPHRSSVERRRACAEHEY